jgi:hypothetical protein
MFAEELAAILFRDVTKVAQEIEAFPDQNTLWQIGPGISNSAGNLALHLEGNLREFIGRQICGVDYTRRRDLEFSSTGVPREEIAARLKSVAELLRNEVPKISPEQLSSTSSHIDPTITQQQFLLHLLGHLNYHLGQIDYARRFFTGQGALDFAKLEP